MSRVWFVSEGDYSSYGVLQVFATRALADTYASGDPHRFIEPDDDEGREVIAVLPEPIEHLTLIAEVVEDGTRHLLEESVLVFPGIDELPKFHSGTYANPRSYGTLIPPRISVRVTGTDLERVRKVFSEQVAQAKAEWHVLIEAERARLQERGLP